MNDRGTEHRRHRPGFTLIEMIAVLVIIGLIVGIGLPAVLGYIDDAKQTKALAQTRLFYSAMQRFYIDNDRYPMPDEGLNALITRPADAKVWPPGGYVDMTRIPIDPWKHAYVYLVETTEDGEACRVISYGRDGAPGGKKLNADIINGELMDESIGETL